MASKPKHKCIQEAIDWYTMRRSMQGRYDEGAMWGWMLDNRWWVLQRGRCGVSVSRLAPHRPRVPGPAPSGAHTLHPRTLAMSAQTTHGVWRVMSWSWCHDVKIEIVCVSKQNKDYKHSVDQPQSAGWLSVITFSYHCSIRINVETLQRFIVNYGLEINMCAEQNSMNCTASTPIDISFCIQRIYESISEVCMYQYLVFQNSAIVFVP